MTRTIQGIVAAPEYVDSSAAVGQPRPSRPCSAMAPAPTPAVMPSTAYQTQPTRT